MKVLVGEDDPRIASSVATALSAAGFIVQIEHDGDDIWHRGDTEEFDAVVLDLGLPSTDGLTVLKQWRREKRTMPILVLTARDHWQERVEVIELGADDYLVKPFQMEEVVARVRAIVRRAAGHATSRLEVAEFVVDTRLMRVFRRGVPQSLAPQEYRLVAFLAHRAGQFVSQREIADHLYPQDEDRESNAVEVLVGRTRRKLGDGAITTRRGFGYCLGPEGS